MPTPQSPSPASPFRHAFSRTFLSVSLDNDQALVFGAGAGADWIACWVEAAMGVLTDRCRESRTRLGDEPVSGTLGFVTQCS